MKRRSHLVTFDRFHERSDCKCRGQCVKDCAGVFCADVWTHDLLLALRQATVPDLINASYVEGLHQNSVVANQQSLLV